MSHDFFWTADSVMPQYFQFRGIQLWGTSDSNVYLAAHNSDNQVCVAHFNGHVWTGINMRGTGLHTATAIDGIDSSHFVVVGDGGVRGAIARYRNGAWDTLRTPFLRPSVHGVDMVSESEIYISCVDGILFHNGSDYRWIVDSTKSIADVGGYGYPFNPGDVIKGRDGCIYYTQSNTQRNGSTLFRMYCYNNGSIDIMEEFVDTGNNNSQRTNFWIRNVGMKILTGLHNIYSLSECNILLEHNHEGALMTGTDVSQNLFASTFNQLYHYNGVSWADITPDGINSNKNLFAIRDIVYIDRTIFMIVSFDGYHTIVYRGKHIN